MAVGKPLTNGAPPRWATRILLAAPLLPWAAVAGREVIGASVRLAESGTPAAAAPWGWGGRTSAAPQRNRSQGHNGEAEVPGILADE